MSLISSWHEADSLCGQIIMFSDYLRVGHIQASS